MVYNFVWVQHDAWRYPVRGARDGKKKKGSTAEKVQIPVIDVSHIKKAHALVRTPPILPTFTSHRHASTPLPSPHLDLDTYTHLISLSLVRLIAHVAGGGGGRQAHLRRRPAE